MASKNQFFLSPVFCLHNGAVVLNQDENTVTFGLLNNDDEILKRRLENAVESKLKNSDSDGSSVFVSVNKEEFNKQISWMFAHEGEVPKSANINKDDKFCDNEVAALLEALISNAVKENASDIHIEKNIVRFRIGGKLYKEIELSDDRKLEIVQRIKLLACLNVVEHRKPQDGHFVFVFGNKKIFIRVSCLPIVGSLVQEDESVVMRLLDPGRIPLRLDRLGFDENQIKDIKKFCDLENGLILICGATGSGKSTTAGAMLEEIKKGSNNTKKIISLEDPPEYVLDGVSQVQIQECHDLGFTEILRRTFRQDPDVIFIGEIRDKETAEIAVQAALTGHLVFATLHTGTVGQAVLRMYDLGVSPKLVNAVLCGIIVQHLVDGRLSAKILSLNPSDVVDEMKKENRLE